MFLTTVLSFDINYSAATTRIYYIIYWVHTIAEVCNYPKFADCCNFLKEQLDDKKMS